MEIIYCVTRIQGLGGLNQLFISLMQLNGIPFNTDDQQLIQTIASEIAEVLRAKSLEASMDDVITSVSKHHAHTR